MRAVFDTNVLIDGFADDFSASARLIDAVREQKLEAYYTVKLRREYELLLQRLIDNPDYRRRIEDFLATAHAVSPGAADVRLDDPEDYKVAEAAAGGEADVIITNDHHLLDAGEIGVSRCVTPQEAWVMYAEETGASSDWDNWLKGLGLKH